MIGAIVRAVMVAVIATISLAALLQLAPSQRPFVLAVYLLIMGGLAVHLLVTWLRLLYPRPPASPFDTALAARAAPPRPSAELDRLARLLALSSASALHAHTRLRAELRPVAADRLAGRWPSTWTATPTPPGPPSASPGGRCSPATSATCPTGRRPACPRPPWPS
jgi:hypothetical protein